MSLENRIVDYKDHEADIEHWVKLKGEYRYEAIINFLKGKGIKCTWETVTDYVRYDKRLVINSIKYIIILEELYTSFVCSIFETRKPEYLKTFRIAYNEYLALGNEASYDGVDLEVMEKYNETLNDFRNKAVHNDVLICEQFEELPLEETLKCFIKILPKSYRKGFIRDINACARDLKVEKWHIELPVSEQ